MYLRFAGFAFAATEFDFAGVLASVSLVDLRFFVDRGVARFAEGAADTLGCVSGPLLLETAVVGATRSRGARRAGWRSCAGTANHTL